MIPAADIWAVTAPAFGFGSVVAVCVAGNKAVTKLSTAYQVVTVSAKPQPPQKAAEPSPASLPLPSGPFPSVPHAAPESTPEPVAGGAL